MLPHIYIRSRPDPLFLLLCTAYPGLLLLFVYLCLLLTHCRHHYCDHLHHRLQTNLRDRQHELRRISKQEAHKNAAE